VKGNPIVFIVDKSGSMGHRWSGTFSKEGKTWTRDSYVNHRLAETLRGLRTVNLPYKTQFNVIHFAATASQVFSNVVDATPANVEHAIRVVTSKQANGGTNAHAAFALAYKLRAGSIYFLTDGRPNNGRTNADVSRDLLNKVKIWQGTKKIPVHCIGVFAGKNTGTHLAVPFLTELAKWSGGDLTKVH